MFVHRWYNFKYNQKDATILIYLFLKRSTCFRRLLRPSSGAHNCTHSFRYCQPVLLHAQYLKLCVQLCAPDDGQMNRLKHVERFRNNQNSCILLVVIKNKIEINLVAVISFMPVPVAARSKA